VAPCNNAEKHASRRAAVVASKRSVLYSILPSSPAIVSVRSTVNSSFEVPVASGTVRSERPGNAKAPAGAFCTASITCASGGRLRSRSGISSSTRRSNGTSWCAKAASVVSRRRPRRVTNVGSPSSRARSTRVLTKRPISGSVSTRVRPATGVATARSSWPVARCSSVVKPARRVMKRVAPCCRARRVNPARASPPIPKRCSAPRVPSAAGRG